MNQTEPISVKSALSQAIGTSSTTCDSLYTNRGHGKRSSRNFQGRMARSCTDLGSVHGQELSDRRRWMFCHREGVFFAWINTNNYVEFWHNSLKIHFFRDKQKWQCDFILVENATSRYQKMCKRHWMQVGRMTQRTS